MTADTIECPFCAEVIKAKAKKCRFCGEFLRQGIDDETILEQHEERLEEIIEAEEVPKEPPPPVVEEAAPETQAPVVTSAEDDTAKGEIDPLEDLYNKLQKMPDSPEKEDDGKGAVEKIVDIVDDILPDAAKAVIETVNTVSDATKKK